MLFIYLFIGFALFLCLLALIGLTISKTHSLTYSINIEKPTELIWNKLRDDLKSAEWRNDLKSVEALQRWNNYEAFKEIYKNGGSLNYAIIYKKENEKLIRKIIHNKNFGGEWIIELRENKVTITENGEIYNPIFRVLGKIFHDPSKTIVRFLNDLKNSFH